MRHEECAMRARFRLDSADAVSTRDARHAHVQGADGLLDLDLLAAGQAVTAEDTRIAPLQVFAAACAAGFHATLGRIAGGESAVRAEAALYATAERRFELGVVLRVSLPGRTPGDARALADQARRQCPYLGALGPRATVLLAEPG